MLTGGPDCDRGEQCHVIEKAHRENNRVWSLSLSCISILYHVSTKHFLVILDYRLAFIK